MKEKEKVVVVESILSYKPSSVIVLDTTENILLSFSRCSQFKRQSDLVFQVERLYHPTPVVFCFRPYSIV